VLHRPGDPVGSPDQNDLELPRRASRIMASSPGRLAFVPLILSVYSSTIWQPRC
jgi:hypothetical protein